MFGVDFSEIALIFLIALVVLGPAKLPQVAATVGRWIGRARVMARQFREQLEQEANTLKQATDLRSTTTPAAPPPAEVKPEHATPAENAAPAESAAPAADTVHTEAAPPDDGPPQMDSNVRFDIAASPVASEATASVAADPAPEHLDHPAPLPAEPHERGA
jgi:sec-independent protein translocase protein TatB